MAKIENDKYYTPTVVVKKIIEIVEKEIAPINSFKRIIEPSSGGGAFIKELPEHTVGYDIEPTFFNDNITKGDYLKQNIEYMENSLVIGNPPFDDGSGANILYKKFIDFSLIHSDYVVFIVPKATKQIQNGYILKSYRIPKIKYTDRKLKSFLVIYKRGEKSDNKKIKGVKIEWFKKLKTTTNEEIEAWRNRNCDYRIVAMGTLKIIEKSNPKVHCFEIKITFDKKIHFRDKLDIFLKTTKKNSISKGNITIGALIDFIWDNYPELRSE